MSAAKKTKGLTIFLLLVSFRFFVLAPPLPIDLQEIAPGRKAILFTHPVAACAVSVLKVDRRSLSNSSDGLFESILIPLQVCSGSAKEFSSFLSENIASILYSTDQATVSIRAPPSF
ncbi:MAG: hypothetical protein ACOWWM_11040 [Desulfobacterales bacterium]